MGKRFVISNEDVNEYGFWVKTDGVDLRAFFANPVMLFEHESSNYGDAIGYVEKLPIGKWKDVTANDGVISGVPEFDEGDTFAVEVKRKVENGYLNAVSAGLKPIELSDDESLMKPGQSRMTLVKSRLKEGSFVKFPANLGAVRLYDDGGQVVNLSDNRLDSIITLLSDKNQIVNMKSIAQKLGLSADATEAQIVEALQVLLNARTEMLLLSAREKGIVNDQNEAHFRKMAETSFEAAQGFLLSQKPATTEPKSTEPKEEPMTMQSLFGELKKLNSNGGAGQENRDNWSWNDWEEKDPAGLKELQLNDPEKAKKLVLTYKAKK